MTPNTTAPPVDYNTPSRASGGGALSWIALACSMLFFPGVLAAGMLHPDIPAAMLAVLVGLPLTGVALGIVARRMAADTANAARWRAKSAYVLGGVILGLVTVVAVLLPSLCRSSEQANRVKCANNLRQIGMALLEYANAHDGQFPATLESLLTSTDITSDVLICPSTHDTRATGTTPEQQARSVRGEVGHISYVYVAAGLTSNKSSASTILAYDNPHNHRDEGINVLYGDGHVEFVDKKEAERIVQGR